MNQVRTNFVQDYFSINRNYSVNYISTSSATQNKVVTLKIYFEQNKNRCLFCILQAFRSLTSHLPDRIQVFDFDDFEIFFCYSYNAGFIRMLARPQTSLSLSLSSAGRGETWPRVSEYKWQTETVQLNKYILKIIY